MLVLVTGGAGFIGSHTVDSLIEDGYDVIVIDNLQKPVHMHGKPPYLNPKAKYIWEDVNNKSILSKYLKNVDYIFHFAAYQDYLPDFSRFFQINSVSTALLYEIIVEKKIPIKKIIVASSQFVQGEGIYQSSNGTLYYPNNRTNVELKNRNWDFIDDSGKPLEWKWTGESYANPPNQYAISKYSQELMSLNFGQRFDIPSVALRYSIVQGSRQSFYNAYSGACRIFSLHYFFDKAPTVFEDGEMKRDFVNIKDVVKANLLSLKKDEANGQVFNVGGGKAISIVEFAESISEAYDKKDLKPKIEGHYRFGDTRNACSDITKIRNILGWSPEFSINDSILEYKEYLISQKNIKDILYFTEQNMKNLNVIRKSVV